MAKKKVAKKAKRVAKRAPGTCTTLVNGQVTGQVPNSGSIQAACEVLARNAGLKAYQVRVNGRSITTPEAQADLKAKTLEIYAKDTRG